MLAIFDIQKFANIDNYTANKLVSGTADNDSIYNEGDSVTIDSGDGNDTITSYGINLQSSIWSGDNVTIDAGLGDDVISISGYTYENFNSNGLPTSYNEGSSAYVLIQYAKGDGNDTVYGFNESKALQIIGATYSTVQSGNDLIVNVEEGSILLKDAANISVNIDGTVVSDGNTDENTDTGKNNSTINGVTDSINKINYYSNQIITGSSSADSISNYGNSSSIFGYEGNDFIYNDVHTITGTGSVYTGDNSFIQGDEGDDSIGNWAKNVTIYGGTGDDKINNGGTQTYIDGGDGNDSINLYEVEITTPGDEEYRYPTNVTINGGKGNDYISMSGYNGNAILQYSKGDGNDTIKGIRYSDKISITDSTYSTTKSGKDLIIIIGEGSILLKDAANTSVNINDTRTPVNTTTTTITPATTTETITSGEVNTGSSAVNSVTTDSAGNVIISTSAGTQSLNGAAGKTVQFSNDYIQSSPISVQFSDKPSINDEAKFYWATTTDAEVSFADYTQSDAEIKLNNSNFNDTNNIAFYGDIKTINATGYKGDAVLEGQHNKDNIIYGGDGNSVLWGGYNSDDILVGGSGSDIFWYTQNSGNDLIRNTSSNDIVRLADIKLDDIVAIGDALFVGNDVQINLKSGEKITVENAKLTGVVFEFESDGQRYAVNQSTGEWEFR